MGEVGPIALGFGSGLLLGGVYFGGLWWTVQRGLTSQRAGVWFALSFLVRTLALAAGLYALAHGNIGRGVAAGAGVIAVRFATVRLRRRGNPTFSPPEVRA